VNRKETPSDEQENGIKRDAGKLEEQEICFLGIQL
jgi:hypothetical protein